MLTTFARKAKNFTASGMYSSCRGANHSDRGRQGMCDLCHAEVVEVVKGDRAYLANKGFGPGYFCWTFHTCDPERAAEVAADKAAKLASGVVMKGSAVVVARGRKVPKGTTGVVFWMGVDDWGKGRLGFKDAEGTTHWSATANVDPVVEPEVAATVEPDVAAGLRLRAKHDYECVTWATFTKGLTEAEAEAGLADGTVTCMCRSTRGRRY